MAGLWRTIGVKLPGGPGQLTVDTTSRSIYNTTLRSLYVKCAPVEVD